MTKERVYLLSQKPALKTRKTHGDLRDIYKLLNIQVIMKEIIVIKSHLELKRREHDLMTIIRIALYDRQFNFTLLNVKFTIFQLSIFN